ncbi:MAG: MCE family protein [Chloroflexi bacterium]|nr:MAG: MCE family protein [Chloroflexota bacterium]
MITPLRESLRRLQAPALLIGVIVLALVALRITSGLTEYRLTIPIDSADGLYPGSDVLIAGAKAGSVQDIKLDGGQALVTITLDEAHAPVHSDARATIRPKSLLGEKYVALEPGTGSSDALAAGSRLPQTQVAQAVDLQDVVNTLDQPTREKLRTLVIELGGGLAGQGTATNDTIAYGTKDMNDLATIANTLAARDQDLQKVIQGLDQVTAELAKSDRRQQLGVLIQNSETLLHSLAAQDTQIKRALVETNAALSRTDTALSGLGPRLNSILRQAPRLSGVAGGLSADLSNAINVDLAGNNLTLFDQGMKASTTVFGARDSGGNYATRITVVLGPGATGVGIGFLHAPRVGPDSLDAVLGILLGTRP